MRVSSQALANAGQKHSYETPPSEWRMYKECQALRPLFWSHWLIESDSLVLRSHDYEKNVLIKLHKIMNVRSSYQHNVLGVVCTPHVTRVQKFIELFHWRCSMSLKMHVVDNYYSCKCISGFLGPRFRFGHKRVVLDQDGYEAELHSDKQWRTRGQEL
jgi:hypothetical protein